MEHDTSYKLLFSHARMVEDLLRGFVHEAWLREVDFTTWERVSGSHVSDDLRDREDDMIWRVRWGADWLYIYLLLEFQATVDPYAVAARITPRCARYNGGTSDVSGMRDRMDPAMEGRRLTRGDSAGDSTGASGRTAPDVGSGTGLTAASGEETLWRGLYPSLAPLLEARQDTESLAEIGEWMVTCQTGEAFLTKVQEQFPSS
jgi:hypothetical protein